jgi:hypothetical protein
MVGLGSRPRLRLGLCDWLPARRRCGRTCARKATLSQARKRGIIIASHSQRAWKPNGGGPTRTVCRLAARCRSRGTLEAFVAAFATLGYTICTNGDLEQRYEKKVAIYAQNGVPTHAAKQLHDGRWKSKLGAWEDIEHSTLKAVEEHIYERAALFMRRKVSF